MTYRRWGVRFLFAIALLALVAAGGAVASDGTVSDEHAGSSNGTVIGPVTLIDMDSGDRYEVAPGTDLEKADVPSGDYLARWRTVSEDTVETHEQYVRIDESGDTGVELFSHSTSADVDVSAVVGREAYDGSYDRNGSVNIWLGVRNESTESPVDGHPVTVEVTRPDGSTDRFNVTTDANGSAHVGYDLQNAPVGNYEVDVYSGLDEYDDDFTEFAVGPHVNFFPGWDRKAEVGETTTIAALVTEADEPVIGRDLSVTVRAPNGTERTQVLTTDSDGVATFSLTPRQAGHYDVETNLSGGSHYSVEAAELFAKINKNGHGYGISVTEGEPVAVTGAVADAGEPFADETITVGFRNVTDYDESSIVENKTVTTDAAGQFELVWTPPSRAGTVFEPVLYGPSGERVQMGWGHRIEIEADEESGDGGDAPAVNLDLDHNKRVVAPDGEITVVAHLARDGSPVENEVVTFDAGFGGERVPYRRTSVKTNASGAAAVTFALPAEAPDRREFEVQASVNTNDGTVSRSQTADIQRYRVGSGVGKVFSRPGDVVNYSISATDVSTGDPVSGVPVIMAAEYTGFNSGVFFADSLRTGQDGTAQAAVQLPADATFEVFFGDVGSYISRNTFSVTYPQGFTGGTVSTDDEVSRGEILNLSYTANTSTTTTAIVTVANNDASANAPELLTAQRVLPEENASIRIPTDIPDGTDYEVQWVVVTASGEVVMTGDRIAIEGGPLTTNRTENVTPRVVEQWNFTTGDDVSTSPAVTNGTVYVGNEGHKVYALDAETGTEQWTFTTGGRVYSSPVVDNGTVYVGSRDDKVYALDAETGTEHWNFTTGGPVSSSPAVNDGTVYVGSHDDRVYALDAETGTEHWNFTTGDGVDSSPALDNGTVYVGSQDKKVYALDAETGTLKWSFATDYGAPSSPTVDNGTVYVGSSDDRVYALDTETGTLKWSFATGSYVPSSPAVDNGTVYVGSRDDKVYALDAETGTEQWTFTTGDHVYSSPAVNDGTVYVGSFDDRVYALDAETGTEHWNFTTGDSVDSSPAVNNGTVYVGSDDTKVYALRTIENQNRNQYPSAAIEYSPQSPVTNESVTFNASASRDPDGHIVSYEWDFGDGTTTTGQSIEHAYTASGNYTVSLTVTDNASQSTTVSRTVTVVNGTQTLVVDGDADGDDEYATIQAAVDDASDGDTVSVRNGSYAGVTLDKNLTLVAPNGATIDNSSAEDQFSAILIQGHAEPTVSGFTLTRSVGVSAFDSKGDWTIRDTTIVGGEFGIGAGRQNAWTIANVTIINTGRGITAGSADGDWTVRNSTFEDNNRAIFAADASGNWTVRESIFINTSHEAIFAFNTQGAWAVTDVRFERAGAMGVDAGESTADWTVQNTTFEDTPDAIVADDAVGDWTVSDSVFTNASDVAIDAFRTEGAWTVKNVTVERVGNTGINAYESTGDWTVRNATIVDSGRLGIEASQTAGDWRVLDSVVHNATVTETPVTPRGVGIAATDTTGDWEVYGTILTDNENAALNATNATFAGDATHNYWGASDGPGGDFAGSGDEAVGNVTVRPYYTDADLTTLSDATPAPTVESLIEHDASTVEVAFSGAVRPADSPGETLGADDFTAYVDGEPVPVRSVDHDGGGRADVHLGRSVNPTESLTLRVGAIEANATGTTVAATPGNRSVTVTGQTVSVLTSTPTNASTFRGAPVALYFGAGQEDTDFEITNQQTGIFIFSGTTGPHSRVAVLDTESLEPTTYRISAASDTGAVTDLAVRDLGLTASVNRTTLTEGGELTLEVTAAAGNRTIEGRLVSERSGEVSSGSLTLDRTGTVTADLTVPEPGNYTIEFRDVSTGIVTETDRITVLDAPEFTVERLSGPVTMSAGDRLALTATVRNTGALNGTTTVAFEFGGEVTTRTVTLAPGTSQEVVATVASDPDDSGVRTAVVDTGDDRRSVDVEVTGQQFTCGVSTGDPHLVTFDGVAYDFQAAGEFTLLAEHDWRTRSDPLVVQTRQVPAGDSRSVAMNNATATLVDSHEVMIDAGRATPLWIDGQPVDLAAGEQVAVGNGGVFRRGDTFTVVYPGADENVDATDEHLEVTLAGDRIDLRACLDPARNESVSGLLGSPNGTASDDLALANGTVVRSAQDADTLYGSYRESWRVMTERSLFTYRPGRNASTYDDPLFPETVVTLADLDPDAREDARELAIKAGLEPGTAAFRDAILDYVLTGDSSYFASAQRSNTSDVVSDVDDGATEQPITLAVDAPNASLSPGDNGTVALVAQNVSAGVGAYEVTIGVDNGSVATLTSASVADDPNLTDVTVGPNNQSVTIAAVGLDTADTGAVTVGSITVRGATNGTTDVDIRAADVGSESGVDYSVTVENDTFSVASLDPIVGDRIPTDPDGDGRFEDVNGDGTVDVVDVQALFNAYNEPAVQQHPEAFDLNGNGEVNIVDVQRLFVTVTEAQ